MDTGIKALTGATDAVEGWKHFFEPGDVVGIKVVPNGTPMPIPPTRSSSKSSRSSGRVGSSPRTSSSTTATVTSSWTPATTRSFRRTSDGVASRPGRQPIPARLPFIPLRPIAGYDHDAFVWMDLVFYGDDPKNESKYRSHLGKLVTKTLNKIVAIPVLKDHGSAGVTGALKNMSHGSVNNVARSHSNSFTNVCNQFIPQVVSHPIIRDKFVLQIMDGIRGVFEKGPYRPPSNGRGSITRSSSRPIRWRWTTSSGASSTRSESSRTFRRSQRRGGRHSTPGSPRASTFANLSTSPWRAPRTRLVRLEVSEGPAILDRSSDGDGLSGG